MGDLPVSLVGQEDQTLHWVNQQMKPDVKECDEGVVHRTFFMHDASEVLKSFCLQGKRKEAFVPGTMRALPCSQCRVCIG